MAKKRAKRKATRRSARGGEIKQLVVRALSGAFLETVKGSFSAMLDNLQEKLYETQRTLIKELSLFFFMLVGLIFLLIGVTLLVGRWFQLDLGTSFLFVGLVVLVMVLFFRNQLYQKRRG